MNKEILKHYLRILKEKFFIWYWSMPPLRRKIVGWLLLIGVVWLLLFGSYQIVVGCYHGARSAYYSMKLMIMGEPEFGPEDADLEDLESYSGGSYRHRKFPTGVLDKKRRVVASRVFKANNETHLLAARRLGIVPQSTRAGLEAQKKKLVHLENTRYYKVDPMTHSQPFLVPDAADFLSALGELWQQYHGTHSRFIVTSCTRTDEDVKRLRRHNVNSTKESAHRYGTTIDITYTRFDRRGKVWDGKLRADLERALLDMQDAGHCYVKYEYKQACFHITVRPR